MKKIRRNYFETPSDTELKENGLFVCVGQWANGSLAYSRLDENDEIIEEEDGMYYQIRWFGNLVMVHC